MAHSAETLLAESKEINGEKKPRLWAGFSPGSSDEEEKIQSSMYWCTSHRDERKAFYKTSRAFDTKKKLMIR